MTETRQRLRVRECPVSIALAGVARLHRHLRPPPGAIVAYEVIRLDTRWPVGWALVGRPVSRILAARGYVEVTRVATDGTPNACSALYGACARWARQRDSPIVTYTLVTECGASLRGAGWTITGYVRGRSRGWSTPSRPRHPGRVDGLAKIRWSPEPVTT